MKTSNRASRHAGKNPASVQSGKTTNSTAAKPVAPVVEIHDDLKFTLIAVSNILEEAEQPLSVAAITELLPGFGYRSTPEHVREMLDLLERMGQASCETMGGNEAWIAPHDDQDPELKPDMWTALQKIDNVVAESQFFADAVRAAYSAWNNEGTLKKEDFSRMELGWHLLNQRLHNALKAGITELRSGYQLLREKGSV